MPNQPTDDAPHDPAAERPRKRAQPRSGARGAGGAAAAGARKGARGRPDAQTITWQADVAPLAVSFDDTPDARPALLLVMADGLILTGDILAHPAADADGVAKHLAGAIRGAVRNVTSLPSVIEVRHAEVATALTSLFAAEPLVGASSAAAVSPVACAVRELRDVDDALLGFERSVTGRTPEEGVRPRVAHPDTWAGWGLAPAQIARLFAAAATYYRAAPWRNITNEDIVRLEIDGGDAWSGTVMGHAGELFGLALYSRHDDLLAVLDGEYPPEEMHARMQGPVLSFSFTPRDEISPRTRKEVTWARWEVAAPDAWPDLFTLNTIGGGLTERQMDDLIGALRAIARFARKHNALLRDAYYEPLTLDWRDEKSEATVVFDRPPW